MFAFLESLGEGGIIGLVILFFVVVVALSVIF